MVKLNFADPYGDNILTKGLGPILSREEFLKGLYNLPSLPGDMSSMPKHVRLHYLMDVRDLHIPPLESARVVETMDVLVRQGYRYRNPANAAIWGSIGGEPMAAAVLPRPRPLVAITGGHSGVGKTVAIHRGLDCYPSQVIVHETFPRLKGPHRQLVHLSVDVPPSGRFVDLAANFMSATDDAIAKVFPDECRRFEATLAKVRRSGAQMMEEWRRWAMAHFLGVLHLDEVQNFFKIPTLERRRRSKAGGHEPPLELSIVEDQALKVVLTIANTWGIPVMLSGTPDGVGALCKRLSNTQRFVDAGFHKISEFQSATDPFFVSFMETLGRFQYVTTRLAVDDELRQLVYTLSAGIPRLIVALWVSAHRVAFERREDSLRVADFKKAAATYLAPVGPAVAALISKDPERMRRYEDLMPRDDGFWSSFWGGVGSL